MGHSRSTGGTRIATCECLSEISSSSSKFPRMSAFHPKRTLTSAAEHESSCRRELRAITRRGTPARNCPSGGR
jgi:hypothetical protein